jgi:glycosyltransferase involved in cell wall biosynthesis
VHSKSTYDQINTIHDINPNKINLIPMGNYNLYRKFCSNCRLKDINNKHFKIIFFGKIRKYKGLEELILVFNKVRLKLYNIILVISGECADLKYRHILTNLVDNESIFFNFQSISDMDLHLFFHNSDVVALPFREITSTSSAFIACAFNKPIIAPRMGNLCDFPVNTGFFYDPEDPHGLENALIRAYRERKRCPEYGQNAYRYSQTLSWEDAAAKTMKVYRNVLKM